MLGEVGDDGQRRLEPLADLAGDRGVPVAVGRLGGQHRGEVGVHRGGRLAEPLALPGEVAAHLVGVQVALGVEVADAGGGQSPAVAGVGHEGLQHGDGGGFVGRGDGSSISMCPSSGAIAGSPVRRSASWISTSGFRPGSSRRNSLRMALSP